MNSLRILSVGNMYPPHHLGGAELIWRSAVEHQRAAGHDVRVLTTDYRAADPDSSIAEDPLICRELPWYWEDDDFPRLGLRERLRIEREAGRIIDREIAAFAPDVITWWSMGGLPMSLLKRPAVAGLPALGVLLDDWLIYGPRVDGWQRLCRRLGPLGPLAAAAARIPAPVALDAAANWIFMSETLRSRATDSGLDVGQSQVAYRGVNSAEFTPGEEQAWSGRLLYLGRIDPRKGIAVAIRSLEHLPSCSLSVVGDGDRAHLSELQRLRDELGLGDRVTFKRVARSAVAGELAAADALIFPVLWEEPWGLVPLEAMASGTPVVATGAGGSGEYLEHGSNSVIYRERDDAEALAAAVRKLAGDAELRAQLQAGGLRTAQRYSENSFNCEITAAIEGLVA